MIDVKSLNKTYEHRRATDSRVLKDVSFTLPDTGFVCILGPSGCGKTSLLNAIGGLDVFDNGTLSVDDVSVGRYGTRAYEAERNRNFGYIFQNYYLLENHSVAYNVYLGLHSLKLSHREKVQRVRQALRAVDMERYIRRRVGELSGGQQQRVAIARALARRPKVIFADEPTGNLDEDNTRNICSLLRRASKDSLVLMVTHEEHIARFYADRIITLDDGRIAQDSESWQREGMGADTGKVIYTEGLTDTQSVEGSVTLRLLRDPAAAPVELTVAVLRDRIVLKLSDSRAVTVGAPDESPQIVEGPRPILTLEDVEEGHEADRITLFQGAEAPRAKAGKGVTLPMMFREARNLKAGKRMQRVGMRVFLILLTVLTLLTVGDFIALSQIDPENFLASDSHILTLTMERGAETDSLYGLTELKGQLLQELWDSDMDFDFIPAISARVSYATSIFRQMGSVSLRFPSSMSYAPITRLDESTLLYGRMPERSNEIVVDRRVLKAMMQEGDSIVQNTILDMSFFLDAELTAEKRSLTMVIVGICDSGERSVYVSQSVMLTLCANGSANVMPLSELRALYPDTYGDMTLEPGECLINVFEAGEIWNLRIGNDYSIGGNKNSTYTVKDAIYLDGNNTYAIVDDTAIDKLILERMGTNVHLYCPDKSSMLTYLREKIREIGSENMIIRVSDPYQAQYDLFEEAAHIRADARTIITATILVLCIVMLYLLCRTQAQDRIELLAVYRLLGIPRRKLYIIFLMEGFLAALTAILPAALLTWAGVAAIHRWTEIGLAIVLSWQAAALVSLGILAYYLLVSVLPLVSLLHLPPARLAAKYDM